MEARFGNGSETIVGLVESSSGGYEMIFSQGNSARVSGPYGKIKSISNSGSNAIIVVEQDEGIKKYIYNLETQSWKGL